MSQMRAGTVVIVWRKRVGAQVLARRGRVGCRLLIPLLPLGKGGRAQGGGQKTL